MEPSIPAGTVLARYRVLERIGVGGMGEVYKAFDPSLERHVALKVLPPELVAHQDRLQRFVLEARAASSLSHPNIVTIHEIGEASLEVAGDERVPVHYIAMELIQGETLRQKIERERGTLRTLLEYLAQAADGLAKAHSAGIIHRDLKPENIMVTTDGFAKILDFGLAKLMEPGPALPHDGDAPTAVREKTREGMILGTLGYMSPEQVEAGKVDERSDIFSFGCILYEAVTKKKPFTATSDVDLLHKILHDDPEPISDLTPEVPWELRRIVRRCLAKNPDKRYQSMKDLANELRDLVDDYDQLTPGSGSRMSATSGEHGTQPKSRMLLAGLGLALLIAMAVAITLYLRQSPRQDQPLSQMTIRPLTSSGKAVGGKISPDGRYLAYVAEDRGRVAIYLKQIASGSEVPIMPPSPSLRVLGLTFSADGNYLYITSGEGGAAIYTLSIVPALGGAPRVLISDVDSAVALSPDEKEVAFVRRIPDRSETHLIAAPLDGGKERILGVRKGVDFFEAAVTPSWSPDGQWIAIAGGSLAAGLRVSILLVSADGRETRDLIKGEWFDVGGVAWLPDGSGIVATAQQFEGPIHQVWMFSFPEGEPRRITNDLTSYNYASLSADGKSLVALAGDELFGLWNIHEGAARQLTPQGERNVPVEFDLLPDGSIVYPNPAGENLDIWRWTPDGQRRQLTTHPRADYGAVASPDGKLLYFMTERNGASELWRMQVDGSNQTPIAKITSESSPALSPDGRWVVFPHLGKVWRVSTTGGEPALISQTEAGLLDYSPDGTMIGGAFRISPLPSSMQLGFFPAEGGQPRAVAPPDPTTVRASVRWTPDGKSLTYVSKREGAENIMAQPLDGGEPVRLTNFESGQIRDYRWSPDGLDLYVTRGSIRADMVMISDFR